MVKSMRKTMLPGPCHPVQERKEDERKRLLDLRAKKAQEAKNAKKGKAGHEKRADL